jgi:hypothetical protein
LEVGYDEEEADQIRELQDMERDFKAEALDQYEICLKTMRGELGAGT